MLKLRNTARKKRFLFRVDSIITLGNRKGLVLDNDQIVDDDAQCVVKL
jgi:hypothetical protein